MFSDRNSTVEITYTADDQVATIKAVNPTTVGGTGDQTTTFHYGTGSSTELYTADRLNAIEYPESSTHLLSFTYNYAGEVLTRTDELQIVHTLSYDKLGRLTRDVTSGVPSSVDNTVREIGFTYEKRGMIEIITSYGASSSILNEVKLTYNGFGLLTKEQQDHATSVSGSSYDVDYTYGAGLSSGAGQNTARRLTIEYPSTKTFTYGYGSSGSMDDKLSRLKTISESGTGTLLSLIYNGAAFVVASDRPQSSLRYELRGGAGFVGLDAFDRIVDLRWRNYVGFPTVTTVDEIKYGYDFASNRSWRENVQDSTNSFDWYYTNDGINRLDEGQRGQLNGSYTGLSTKKAAQDWVLDAVGNWRTFKQDFTGAGYTFDQTRTSNLNNEIDTISGTGGADWVDPDYSASGNMTTIPQPGAPTSSYTAKYDAWNRLVELKDTASSNVVAQYSYDGLFRRVVKKTYTSGTLSETRHFYYSDAWQVLEERVEASGSQRLDRQFLWGSQYIDELVLRDRDTNADGTLDERLYAMQDANWNVTALWGLNSGATAWEVKQRFEYDPYGVPTVLSASFGSTTDAYQWETRYAGYRWDGESGLYQVRMRYYHAGLGVWTTKDPMGPTALLNLLAYVSSRPLYHVDPMGLRQIPFKFNAFLHQELKAANATIEPYLPEPFQLYPTAYFRIDDRDFNKPGTSRVSTTGWIESSRLGSVREGDYDIRTAVGASHRRIYKFLSGTLFHPKPLTAPLEKEDYAVSNQRYPGKCETEIKCRASAGYPFATFSPNIDYHVIFHFECHEPNRVLSWVAGTHNRFPYYEGIIDGNLLYEYRPATQNKRTGEWEGAIGPGAYLGLLFLDFVLFRSERDTLSYAETP